MGILYHAHALDDQIVGWLSQLGVPIPPGATSRNPTPREVRTVLDGLANCTVRYELIHGDYWSAWVQHRDNECVRTLVHITHVGGDDDQRPVWFEKGDPELIITIVEALTHRCGVLLLRDDTGVSPPLLITAGVIPARALDPWRWRPGDKKL
jgi:hypothetical protein